jgi:hypothetical protein
VARVPQGCAGEGNGIGVGQDVRRCPLKEPVSAPQQGQYRKEFGSRHAGIFTNGWLQCKLIPFCFVARSEVLAMSHFLIGLISFVLSSGAPQCVTEYGKTVCGYSCVARYHQVKCSETPQGICYPDSKSESVICWDPPVASRVPAAVGSLQASCITEYGQTVCGYSCKAKAQQVKCAQTPDGICETIGGEVVCWDPAGDIRQRFGSQIPKPQCIREYGKTACGYECLARHNQVRCTETPAGKCRLDGETVVCWDPER